MSPCQVVSVRPSSVRYSQDSISTTFQDGRTLEDTFRQLMSGAMNIESLPQLHVVEINGVYWVVMGNRRLLLLRKLEQHGKITTIQVVVKDVDYERFSKMKTTKNEGRSIRCRGNQNLETTLDSIARQHKGLGGASASSTAGKDDSWCTIS